MDAIRARRIAGWLIVAILAAITGVVSYFHALWVVQHTGTSGLVAYLVPFVPDLLITSALLTLAEGAAAKPPRSQDKTGKPGSPWEAWLSLALGIAVTIMMNVYGGKHWIPPGGSLSLAALIPIAFILTFHTLLAMIRRAGSVPLSAEPARCGHKVATSLDEAVVMATAVLSYRQIEKAFGVNRNRVSQLVRAADGELPEPSPNGDGPHE